ncbi:MAG: DNA methyltransferase [Armatimonadia bacterium]
MPIDTQHARTLLKQFDLQRLFVEELNWANPQRAPMTVQHDGQRYHLTPQAEQGGFVLFTVDKCPGDGLPDRNTRLAIHKQLLDRAQEHILVFINEPRKASVWMWVEREGGRRKAVYEHRYHVEQPGDSLLQKLTGLAFEWSELDEEGKASIIQVTDRVRANLATERVTKRFYDEFQKQHGSFLKFIKGIETIRDREWYASIMLNRLMFVYFVQKKGFLGGDTGYLRTRLADCQMQRIPYYDGFLKTLFFQGFACKPEERTADERELLGEVPYLNGGLFLKHQIEEANEGIDIPDKAFESIFQFFDRYQWHLDDRPLRADNEINPDVLGYIFEKYINQKQMGAYYTKEDITEYITKNTVLPFLFDKVKSFCHDAVVPLPVADTEPYIHDAVKQGVDLELPPSIAAGLDDVSQRGDWNRRADDDYALPTETWREHIARRKRYQQIFDDFAGGRITTVNDFITYNLDIIKFTDDFISETQDPLVVNAFYFNCLKTVTVLDPTCGSGAFLFAALNILEPLYERCLQRMEEFLARKQRHPQWAQPFEQELKRVDAHPSRRYFIYKSIIVSNLYGVDIMEEAVEICKLRLFLKLVAQVEDVAQIEPLPDIDFNIRAGNTLVGYASLEEIEQAKAQTMDFSGGNIKQRALALSSMLREFRESQLMTEASAQLLRDSKAVIRREQRALEDELNEDLRAQYGARNAARFVASHRPFHWFVEFTTIMVGGGFDVIIGNPPYVEYAKVKTEYAVRGYATEACGNLYAFVAERCLRLVQAEGRLGLIVPLSSFATERMQPMTSVLRSSADSIWLSNYGIRPSKLFDGVEFRLAIVITDIGRRPETEQFSTRFIRWHSEERQHLLEAQSYCSVRFLPPGLPSIPKASSAVAMGVLESLFAAPECYVADVVQRNQSDFPVFYQEATNYWVKSTSRVPLYERNGERQVAAHSRMLYPRKARTAEAITAIMNSSTFYAYFNMLTDCYHLSDTVVRAFPVPQGLLDDARLSSLGAELMDELEGEAEVVSITTKAGDSIRYASFRYASAKPTMDAIDRVLAEHYGFTDEELDFIINYDIKYRLGADEADE